MRAARRGVALTSGGPKSIERGIAYDRTRRNKSLHGGMRPRMGARDLWDVSCWCGWASTGHERRDLAAEAASEHRQFVARGTMTSTAKNDAPSSSRRVQASTKRAPPEGQRDSRIAAKVAEPSTPPELPQYVAGEAPVLLQRGSRRVAVYASGSEWRARCSSCRWASASIERDKVVKAGKDHVATCPKREKENGACQPL